MAEMIGWSGIHKKITSPNISSSAVALARITISPSNFYNASFKLRYTGFSTSLDVLVSVKISNGAVSRIMCYSIGETENAPLKFLYKVIGSGVYIYATGSYNSVYTKSFWDVYSSDARVDFNVDNTPVSVDGLDATEITNKIASFG